MDKQYTVLLGETRSKMSTNGDVNIAFDVTENRRILPEDVLVSKLDEYEQYVKEKDACTKFNMIFTVNAIASNVLFNRVSEIVYHEGSDDCIFFGKDAVYKAANINIPDSITQYNDYKRGVNNTTEADTDDNTDKIILTDKNEVLIIGTNAANGIVNYAFDKGITDIAIYSDIDSGWITVEERDDYSFSWYVTSDSFGGAKIGRVIISGRYGTMRCDKYVTFIRISTTSVKYAYFAENTLKIDYNGKSGNVGIGKGSQYNLPPEATFYELSYDEDGYPTANKANWASGKTTNTTLTAGNFKYLVSDNTSADERNGFFEFKYNGIIVGRLYVYQGGKPSDDGDSAVDTTFLTRYKLLRDTAYSHKDIGGLVYHCGYDIFGNHMLRKAGFNVINKISSDERSQSKRANFNTISDYCRDFDGKIIKDNVSTISKIPSNRGSAKTDLKVNSERSDTHQYLFDTLLSINDTIRERLIEKNGWFGFINPSGMDIKNYGNIAINKCMNNNKACEQIDMYPDRSLFTMVPKYNKYRNRVENNWDYCLTFPYKNFYDHELVTSNRIIGNDGNGVNGLECTLITRAASLLFNLTGDFELEYKDNAEILFSTNVNHNLNVGDTIRMWVKYSGETYELETNVLYVGLGGDYPNYFFTINSSTFEHIFSEVKTKEDADENTYNIALPKEGVIDYGDDNDYDIENGFINWNNDEDEIRFAKLVKGRPCDYYLRLFKKVPNFKNTDVYADGVVTEDEIEECSSNKFNSSLNNLAFSNNIYGDPIAQIIFNDDIEINGLKDNLGRDISELYLTIIKRNKGYEKWYGLDGDKNYWDEDIEYSHCFGKITAGFDVMPYVDDYNVHRIHNVDLNKFDNPEKFQDINPSSAFTVGAIKNYYKTLSNFQESAKCLEGTNGEITIDGDTFLNTLGFGDNIFFGDIVEFSLYDVAETVLEDVNFRFNTVQREYTNDSEFYNFIYEEITEDDYKLFDLTQGATVDKRPFKTSAVTYNMSNTVYRYVKDDSGKKIFNMNYPFNISPEGYYYMPHTRIPVREYSSVVKQGSHTEIIFSPATTPLFDCDGNEIKGRWKTMSWDKAIEIGSTNEYNIITAKNYYVNVGDKLLLFEKGFENKAPIEGHVVSVDGKTFNYLKVKFDEDVVLYENTDEVTEYEEIYDGDTNSVETFNGGRVIKKVGRIKYKLFKYNVEKPANALELNDGTGNYLWRPFLSESALTQDDELYNRPYTNGRIYVHKFVDLFLRRQDPYNDYGLNCDDCATKLSNLTIYGEYKDVTQYDSEEPVESKLCASIIGDMMTNVGEQLETMSKSRISNFNIDKVVDSYRDKRKAKKERDAAAQQQNAQNQG